MMSDEYHKPLIIINLWQTKTRFVFIHLLKCNYPFAVGFGEAEDLYKIDRHHIHIRGRMGAQKHKCWASPMPFDGVVFLQMLGISDA
jgi:hypothetical protein